jgi:hypothetical protein
VTVPVSDRSDHAGRASPLGRDGILVRRINGNMGRAAF